LAGPFNKRPRDIVLLNQKFYAIVSYDQDQASRVGERRGGNTGSQGFEALRVQPKTRVERKTVFFIFFLRNPLKSPDSEKLLKGNESKVSFISFHKLAFPCEDFALQL
jgi:hypothetical protein